VRVQVKPSRRSVRRPRKACAQVRCAAPRVTHRSTPRAATIHASRVEPGQRQRRASRAAPKHGAKRPRGLRRSKSGMRPRSIFPAAKNRASRKNALSTRLWFGPRRQRIGAGHPASAARICRWRGAALVASRGRCGKSLRSASLPRACASLSWLAAWQPSSPIGPVAAPACLFGRPPSCLKPKPPRAATEKVAPSSGAKKGRRQFRGSGPKPANSV